MALAVLAGCTMHTGTQALTVAASAANVKFYYENGQAVDFLDNAELTEQEAETVVEALLTIDKAKARLNALAAEPADLVINLSAVQSEYLQIRSAYSQLRHIVIANMDEYAPEELAALEAFDRSALALEREFTDLVRMAESSAAFVTALRLADTAIKIAAVM